MAGSEELVDLAENEGAIRFLEIFRSFYGILIGETEKIFRTFLEKFRKDF